VKIFIKRIRDKKNYILFNFCFIYFRLFFFSTKNCIKCYNFNKNS